MTASTATLKFTSSREADNALRIARVAAAGRVAAERAAQRRRREQAWAFQAQTGQWVDPETFEAYCYICHRCTDHTGEHTPEQVAAYVRRERLLAGWED